MKVAVEISGQQRYGPYFSELLKSLSIFDEVDLYLHHWDNPRSEAELRSLVEAQLAPNMKLRAMSIEPQKQFDVPEDWELLIEDGSSIFNLMSMTYSMLKCSELHGDEYDLVIRIRPDLRLTGFPSSQRAFDFLDDNTICVGYEPIWFDSYSEVMQDQVAMGRATIMRNYNNLYNHLEEYHTSGKKFHPETVFYWWNITVSSTDILYGIFVPEMNNSHITRELRSQY